MTALPDLEAFELSGMHWGSLKKNEEDEKRVWQSSPLNIGTEGDEDGVDLYSDLFFAY